MNDPFARGGVRRYLDTVAPEEYVPMFGEVNPQDLSLTGLADLYGSDKGRIKHNYTMHYERIIEDLCRLEGVPRADCMFDIAEAGIACAGCRPCHWISVGSAPPHSSAPSGRTRISQASGPWGVSRPAFTGSPGCRPTWMRPQRCMSSCGERATACTSCGPEACSRSRSAGSSRPNQRGRAGAGACGSMAMISR